MQQEKFIAPGGLKGQKLLVGLTLTDMGEGLSNMGHGTGGSAELGEPRLMGEY